MIAWLCLVAGTLALLAAGSGLLWQGAGHAYGVTSPRGTAVEIYGRGLYAHDTLFFAGANKATDLVTLVLGLPLLAASARLFRRGTLRGRLLLLGTLGYFTYVGATYALGGVAYNSFFLVYVGLFSSSLFALVLTFLSFSPDEVRAGFAGVPRRWPGVFMLASGAVTLVIWLMEPVGALIGGSVPRNLATHTTLFTNALDMAVIVPAAMGAGVMILRGRPHGYVVAFSLLVLEALLLPLIGVSTVVQIRLGVSFTPGEVVGPVIGFGIFAALSAWVIVSVLRGVREAT